MKYLITGCSGFVAKHLVDYIVNEDPRAMIFGLDMKQPSYLFAHTFSQVNLLDYAQLENTICEFGPDYILHLASFSSVGKSWEKPKECFANNTSIFLNLAEVVRINKLNTRILSIGSSEEYGIVDKKDIPIVETQPLEPISPYAIARTAQEQLSVLYAESYNIDVVITRSFNHVGPGQEPIFAVPSIVRQFVICPSNKTCNLATGNTDIVRDFLDVRDVVKAYYSLLKKGRRGAVYNICSGNGHSIAEVIDMISKISGKPYTLSKDPTLVRPNDNPIIIGSSKKLQNETGWKPLIPLYQSLEDIYIHFSNMENL